MTHLQESAADKPDPQASALADTHATPVASTLATAEKPDMPAALAASSTPGKERPPVVVSANDLVKVYSMMHPGQRQHKLARLKVHNQVLLRSCTRWQNSSVPLSCFPTSAGTNECVVHRGCVLTGCGLAHNLLHHVVDVLLSPASCDSSNLSLQMCYWVSIH